MTQRNTHPGELAETQTILQALAAAVTADDVHAYRTALRQAWRHDLTHEQVTDAWTYRARRRTRAGRAAVTFDEAGCHR